MEGGEDAALGSAGGVSRGAAVLKTGKLSVVAGVGRLEARAVTVAMDARPRVGDKG